MFADKLVVGVGVTHNLHVDIVHCLEIGLPQVDGDKPGADVALVVDVAASLLVFVLVYGVDVHVHIVELLVGGVVLHPLDDLLADLVETLDEVGRVAAEAIIDVLDKRVPLLNGVEILVEHQDVIPEKLFVDNWYWEPVFVHEPGGQRPAPHRFVNVNSFVFHLHYLFSLNHPLPT